VSTKTLSDLRKQPSETVLRASVLAAGLMLLGALAQFARTGWLSRYWADDYCYSWVMRAGGLLRGPLDWYMSSGNRFSTILLVGFQDLFGPAAIRWIPGLVLLLWVLAWVVCIHQAAQLFKLRVLPLWVGLFALVQVFFAALLAPDRLQTLYWRMGTLHYSFPLLLLLLNLALAAGWRRRAGRGLLWGAAICALSFFAGGFSETFAAMQTGVYLLILAAGLALGRGVERRQTVRILLPGLAGALAAMVLMMLSPSNAWRQAALPATPSLPQLIELILRYTFDFTRDTLRGLPVPLLILAALSALIAYAGFWRERPAVAQRGRILLYAAGFLCMGILLAACAIAPSVYAGGQFPAGRALMPTRFALLSGIALAAACLPGLLPVQVRRSDPAALLAALLTLAACFYPLRAAAALEPQRRELAAWAVRWDARDAQIQSLRTQGQTDPLVRQVEVVSGLEDMGPDPGNWVNRCAAGYYILHSITAKP
jgi:hypothetical protein